MTSVSAQTAARLRWHAGLDRAPPERGSVCWATDPSNEDADARRSAVDDVIAALARMNHELNGASPSLSTEAADPLIPSSVAYSVAEVVRMLSEYSDLRSAWRVATAWLAVLAGDIDDIEAHVAGELRARGLHL